MIAIADLRDVCGIAAGDETFDARLVDLEAEAVAWVQRRTGRYFQAEAEVTERLIGAGSAKLRLAEAPTSNPSTVTEYAYVGADAETVTASEDDGFVTVTRTYPTASNEGWLERKYGYVWADGYIYEVTYDRGYTLTGGGSPDDIAAPDDIRALVKNMVRFSYFSLAHDPTALSETIGGYSYRRGAVGPDAFLEASPAAVDTINRWARMVYA